MNDKDEFLQQLMKDFQQALGNYAKEQEESIKLKHSRKFITDLCRSFDQPTKIYDPKNSYDIVDKYMHSQEKLPRILYSEISNNIFSANDRIGNIMTNLECLIKYALESESELADEGSEQDYLDREETVKTILRVYDHIHLAASQIAAMEKIAKDQGDKIQQSVTGFEEKIEKIKNDYEKKVEKAQQNYVTVLGMFIAILLAIGGIFAESSAIFSNIAQADSAKFILTVSILTVVLGNIIFFMANFIAKISGVNSEVYEKWWLYYTIALVAGILLSYGLYFIMPVIHKAILNI